MVNKCKNSVFIRQKKKKNRNGFNNPNNRVCVCGFSARRLSLKLEYERYGSVITSDRLIQLSAITFNKESVEYYKAEKTIVLDEPEIEIKVWMELFHLADIDPWVCHLQTI